MSAHAPINQGEVTVIRVGDRVTWTEAHVRSVLPLAYHELNAMQGTGQAVPQEDRRWEPMAWVWWDGDDRDRVAAIDVLQRVD